MFSASNSSNNDGKWRRRNKSGGTLHSHYEWYCCSAGAAGLYCYHPVRVYRVELKELCSTKPLSVRPREKNTLGDDWVGTRLKSRGPPKCEGLDKDLNLSEWDFLCSRGRHDVIIIWNVSPNFTLLSVSLVSVALCL